VDGDLVREGDRPTESSLLLDGFAARYKLLRNGRRQITALHIPGDFVDLHSFLLKKMDHGVVALTRCRVGLVPHSTLHEITETHLHLGRLLWLSTLIDAAIHREWLVAMGRRPALNQIAHLVCELFLRLQAVGLTQDKSFELPLTQAELGDVLGLSTVHVNRVIQQLRADGVITWSEKRIVIEDWSHLQQIAEFDPTFLNLENEPR
jgi:CRP-like cAMP-binding protein